MVSKTSLGVVAILLLLSRAAWPSEMRLWTYILADTSDPSIGEYVGANVGLWRAFVQDVGRKTSLKIVEPKVSSGQSYDCKALFGMAEANYSDSDVVLVIYTGHGAGDIPGGPHVFPRLKCQDGSLVWIQDVREHYSARHPGLLVVLSDSCNFAYLENTQYPAIIASIEDSVRPNRLLAQAELDNLGVAGLMAGATQLNAIIGLKVVPKEQPPSPKLLGLASLLQGHKGWVIGAGAGPTELAWYKANGGAYSNLLVETLAALGKQPKELGWEEVLGYVTKNINKFGFPTETITLVAGQPVRYTQKPIYEINTIAR